TTMGVFVALLRAVNLGGATQVAMSELRDRVAMLGFEDVRSLLNSGNLVFLARESDPARVERRLDVEVAPRLRARSEFFVRSAAEWRGVVDANPFAREAEDDPGHLIVTALKRAPAEPSWRSLAAAIRGRERVRGIGREAYIVYPDGTGRSKLTAAVIERQLGTRGTSRNWNTVRKLDALASL
ncbi:MAG TPA: DUF1697 domain-containing protein, partial [Thermoplasmata archaeon]